MPVGGELSSTVKTRAQRRGPRINSRVPVTVEWTGGGGPLRVETGFTRVVNTYGCLLASPEEIELGQQVRLSNLATHRAADALVVWKGTQRPDGWDIGMELVGADLDFWGIDL
jgi:hypothetical protein